jgi:phage shock protein E
VIKGIANMLRCYSIILAGCLALILPLTALADDPLWIDVRSASEYAEIHVEQALNIPYTEIARGIADLGTDQDAVIYVYCRSGRRSGIAKETLDGMGFTHVVNVGGIEDALKKAGQDSAN